MSQNLVSNNRLDQTRGNLDTAIALPSRRELLAGAFSAALFGAVAGKASAEEPGALSPSQLMQRIDQAWEGEIHFPPVYKTPTPELLQALLDVQRSQRQLLEHLGLKSPCYRNENALDFAPSWESLEGDRRAVWETVKKALPEARLSGYSNAAYFELMRSGLGNALAHYGILAQSYVACISGGLLGQPSQVELVHEFYNVAKCEREIVNIGGREICCQAIFIERPIRVKNAGLGSLDSKGTDYSGLYTASNALIFREAIEHQLKMRDLLLERRKLHGAWPVTDEQALKSAAGCTDPKTFIAECLYRKLVPTADSLSRSLSETEQAVKWHEISHFIDFHEDCFRTHFCPSNPGSYKEFQRRQFNAVAHSEINAFLRSLKRAEHKEQALIEIIAGAADPKIYGSDSYAKALPWIFDQFGMTLAARPDIYGVKIDPKSPVLAELQAALQLDELCRRPKDIERLCDEVLAKHQNSYGLDFNEPVWDWHDRLFSWPRERLVNLPDGLALGLALCAGMDVVKSLFNRRYMLRMKKALREAISDQEQAEKVIEDLQFGRKGRKVDIDRRVSALRTLYELAPGNDRLEKNLKRLLN